MTRSRLAGISTIRYWPATSPGHLVCHAAIKLRQTSLGSATSAPLRKFGGQPLLHSADSVNDWSFLVGSKTRSTTSWPRRAIVPDSSMFRRAILIQPRKRLGRRCASTLYDSDRRQYLNQR